MIRPNVYGDLTVLGPETSLRGEARWRCRCKCGREDIRAGQYLRWAIKHGLRPKCSECDRERAVRRAAARIAHHKEVYRSLWRTCGTLWGHNALLQLADRVREAMLADTPCRPEHYDQPVAMDDMSVWAPDDEGSWSAKEDEGMSLEAVGLTFDPPLSRERVRQIEAKALEKIARGLRAADPALFDHKTPEILSKAAVVRVKQSGFNKNRPGPPAPRRASGHEKKWVEEGALAREVGCSVGMLRRLLGGATPKRPNTIQAKAKLLERGLIQEREAA